MRPDRKSILICMNTFNIHQEGNAMSKENQQQEKQSSTLQLIRLEKKLISEDIQKEQDSQKIKDLKQKLSELLQEEEALDTSLSKRYIVEKPEQPKQSTVRWEEQDPDTLKRASR